jgi:phage-related protein
LTNNNIFVKLPTMTWSIEYYSEKVRSAIDEWPLGIRAFYARITERMKIHGPNLGMPMTRSLGEGLFEIRAIGREGIGRAFFCTFKGRRIIILHVFIKKTDKTPLHELETGRKRLLEVQHENTR